MRSRLMVSLVFATTSILIAQPRDPAALKGYESIKASDLSRHLYVIASDEYEGRETAMKGQKMAAEYIGSHFASLGLSPVGDNGTYFQHFDVEITQLDASNSSLSIQGRDFAWGDGYMTISQVETTLTASAVILGLSDSYIDPSYAERLKGRIGITLPGTHSLLSDTSRRGTLRRLFASFRDRRSDVTLTLLDNEHTPNWETLIEMWGASPRASMRRADLEPGSGSGPSALRMFAAEDLTELLLEAADMTYGELWEMATKDTAFTPIFLDDVVLKVVNSLRIETKQTENVLGYLEGSDPTLRDEVVAVTAHYDHDGITSDGVVYNGADDDGSGTVTVLELAEAFVQNGIRPKRSILFMTVTGEEKGMLGSGYYTDHPVFPLTKTTANMNIDMIGRIGHEYIKDNDSMYVYVIGSDKISKDLDVLLNEANDETVRFHLDYKYNDDKDPNRFYYRSDHYNFAKNGVPVTFFFTGTHPDYHQPTDTPDKILYERMAMIGRLIYTTTWKVANRADGLEKNQDLAK